MICSIIDAGPEVTMVMRLIRLVLGHLGHRQALDIIAARRRTCRRCARGYPARWRRDGERVALGGFSADVHVVLISVCVERSRDT
jgi:hypothetical protein